MNRTPPSSPRRGRDRTGVPPRPSLRNPRRSGRRGRPALLALAAACAASWAWLGCSIEKHHAILSFFFDGVPDPSLVRAGQDAVAYARQTGGVVYVHEPYAKQQCGQCHSGPGGRMAAQVDSTPCLKCHEGAQERYRFMHGPVAAGACLWCHAPHESTVKPMLRQDPIKLCLRCHDAQFSSRRTIAAHADPQRNCVDCHSGHGGSERYFLHPAQGAQHPPPSRSPPPENDP